MTFKFVRRDFPEDWLALRVAGTLEPSAALVTGADRDAFTAKLESLTA